MELKIDFQYRLKVSVLVHIKLHYNMDRDIDKTIRSFYFSADNTYAFLMYLFVYC